MGFVLSPFLSPFALGFLVARQNWRWSYGVGCMYSAVVVFLITFFMEETYGTVFSHVNTTAHVLGRMYDRTLKPVRTPPTTGLRYRIETLVGITGYKMAKYRMKWKDAVMSPFLVVTRPHAILIFIFEGILFGLGIGINVTNAVFLGEAPPVGYQFSATIISALYATPIVACLVGELIGCYVNDYIMNVSIRRNKGVFEAENRLWACYIAIPLYICGFLVLGASFQRHLSVGSVIMAGALPSWRL